MKYSIILLVLALAHSTNLALAHSTNLALAHSTNLALAHSTNLALAHSTNLALAFNSQPVPTASSSRPKSNQHHLSFSNAHKPLFFSKKPTSTRLFCLDEQVSSLLQLKKSLLNLTTILSLACIIPTVIYSIFDVLMYARVEAIKHSNTDRRISPNLFFFCGVGVGGRGGLRWRLIRCVSRIRSLNKPPKY